MAKDYKKGRLSHEGYSLFNYEYSMSGKLKFLYFLTLMLVKVKSHNRSKDKHIETLDYLLSFSFANTLVMW